jgi:hypothetical protein
MCECVNQDNTIITKDDLKEFVETLTENQIVYVFHLLKELFCEGSD